MQEISIDILDWGIFETGGNTFNNVRSKKMANMDLISNMIHVNQVDGEAEIKALQEYLDNNASEEKYSSYYDSDRYVGPADAASRSEFENSEDNAIYVA